MKINKQKLTNSMEDVMISEATVLEECGKIDHLKKVHDKINRDHDFTPIKKLVLKYEQFGLTHKIANLLIGRTESETEENISITREEFQKLANTGKLAFEWHIYGLSYGVPIIIDELLSSGNPVIINVSRKIVPEAREKYKNLKVIFIEVPFELSVKRLKDRNRESENQLKQRIERARTHQKYDEADFIVDNSGLLEITIEKLLDYILMMVKKSMK